MLNEIQGQAEGVAYLQRLIDGHIHSSLLLVGEDGVGRKFSATQAATQAFCTGTKAIGCQCPECVQMAQGVHPDFTLIEPEDGKDIGIDRAREVIEESKSYPTVAPVRWFVVDGADRLTPAAGNALLKTVEEPPPTAQFVLIAQSVDRVLPTIRSRCGVVRFYKLPTEFILKVLERFESDPVKRLTYARLADGSAGRAVSLWGSQRLKLRDRVLQLLELAQGRDFGRVLSGVDDLKDDIEMVVTFIGVLVRDLLVARHGGEGVVNHDIVQQIADLSLKVSVESAHLLREGLRDLYRWGDRAINTPFHVKTLLVRAFC